MSKLFSSILFSFFLLLHTTAIAEESAATQTNVEVQEEQESKASEETEPTDEENDAQGIQEEVEPEEELSEAQKEALAAEEAELRELGMEEEPVAE